MANKKKQHFIPKVYLKQFSCRGDEKQIGLFNVESGLFVKEGQLKNQAQEDFFYGSDSKAEDILAKFESEGGKVIRQIIQQSKMPQYLSRDFIELFYFTIILGHRTKYVANELNEYIDKIFQEMKQYDERLKSIAKDVHVKFKNGATGGIGGVIERIHYSLDLKGKLLLNNTNKPFIASDHPVVKYNQFLEGRDFQFGITGLVAKGLQIFIPISPKIMILFYDNWAYKVGAKAKLELNIDNEEDIDTLNSLQLLNCEELVYFNDSISEHYLNQLLKRCKALRSNRIEYSSYKKIGNSYIDESGNEHITYSGKTNELRINLKLSFIRMTKKAKRHILSDSVLQLRNEQLHDVISRDFTRNQIR